jgi:hypothetical protein
MMNYSLRREAQNSALSSRALAQTGLKSPFKLLIFLGIYCIILNSGKVINHLKNLAAERQRTLKTRARQFQAGKLAWVKALSNKYRETPFCVFL